MNFDRWIKRVNYWFSRDYLCGYCPYCPQRESFQHRAIFILHGYSLPQFLDMIFQMIHTDFEGLVVILFGEVVKNINFINLYNFIITHQNSFGIICFMSHQYLKIPSGLLLKVNDNIWIVRTQFLFFLNDLLLWKVVRNIVENQNLS